MSTITIDDNLAEIEVWLTGLVATFDFTIPGKDQSLGRDLAGTVAQGIVERSVPHAEAADGSIWLANEPKYAAWKARKYSAMQPGILTGQMLSLGSVLGMPAISADTVEMAYGLNEPARRSSTGTALPAGQQPTDREKAEWFSDLRPFFQLDAVIADNCREVARDALGDHLRGH